MLSKRRRLVGPIQSRVNVSVTYSRRYPVVIQPGARRPLVGWDVKDVKDTRLFPSPRILEHYSVASV
jgi:hypothetical protein